MKIDFTIIVYLSSVSHIMCHAHFCVAHWIIIRFWL